MTSLPLLTHSRMKCARSCLREEQLRYVEGWRALELAEPLRLGTLVHKGLEAWWHTRLLADALAALTGEADPFIRAKAEAMLIGYDTRWLAESERYETIAVEQEFRAPLINPDTKAESKTFQLGGKIDVLVRERDTGDVLVCEHKSSSEDISPTSTYWPRLRMDSQVSIYLAGAAALGHAPRACLWDVLGTPSIRPLKATPPESRKYTKDGKLYAAQREVDETPEDYRARCVEKICEAPTDYFQRAEIVRLERDLEDAERDRWQLAQQLRDGHRLERAPRNPDHCLVFGRPCQFFGICSGADSLDDPTRFRRRAFPHPELTDSEKSAA